MKIDIAVGFVVDFGGVTVQGQSGIASNGGDPYIDCCIETDCCVNAECCGNGHHGSNCDSDCAGGCDSDLSGCDSDCSMTALDRTKEKLSLWFGRVALTVQLLILSTVFAFAQATEKAARGVQFAFYIGPTISFGPFYFTFGACLGQFGCFAVGGGLRIAGVGVGILVPIWPWW